MTSRSTDGETQHRVRLTALVERFHCALYPFDLMFLFDRLPASGWIVGERVDEVAAEGIRIRAPVKGNVRLRVDQANMTLGVHGRAPRETLDAYREIRALAREVSPPAPDVQTHYVEFRYVGEVRGSTSPPEALRQWWAQSQAAMALGAQFDRYLATDSSVGPYGVRLAPLGLDANRPNWAELTLLPVNNTGQADYAFDLLFRHADSETVERVAENCEEIVNRLVASIEGRG